MQRSERPSPYDPKAVEGRLYEQWESSGYFHEEPDPARPPFIICMPPPNVTGRAHLGHGSTYTPMDVLVRYHRMLGDNADWIPGTDHAAIATEARIVAELKAQGTTRDALGRRRFLERAWEWSRTYGGEINEAFRALGFGPDWQRLRFTMDDGLSAAVRKVFVKLYRDGLIYRGKRLVNWDPVAKTTISDAEVEHEERDAVLYYVRYPICANAQTGPREFNRHSAHAARPPRAKPAGSPDPLTTSHIIVATTRPETMLGDVAVAVHPEDERYTSLIGKSVLAPPLLERSIPIIADASVDPSFGTGAVKVTPAHDAADYEIGERHGLGMPSIMGLDARISAADVDVGSYEGLSREDARRCVVDALRDQGLLVKEEPYRHAIAISERTGAVIEPLLLEQWFVKTTPLAKAALDAYRDGRIRFVPERYGRTYEQWLTQIRDWNISRQVWWGHQLPVWYTEAGEIVVAESEEEALAQAQRLYATGDLTRDPDTLDTWFSSALWPFSILGWPEQTQELACWYPSQVLVTGYEIIFLWVARMVMLGLYVMGKEPFGAVFVTPLVFDAQGRKMSKSLGNAIDPMELVEKYGADAFRMGMMRQLRLEAQDVRFQESRCEEGRNFNNKIWNASRYALSLPEALPAALTLPKANALTLADRWILTRLHDTIIEVTQLFDGYDFGNAAERLWHFIWYEFCDWYVEATKLETSKPTRAAVLSFVLNNTMRLLHPIEPFISEEVWRLLPHDGETIMTATWPDPLEVPVDRDAADSFAWVTRQVVWLRNERAHGAKGKLLYKSAVTDEQRELIAHFSRYEGRERDNAFHLELFGPNVSSATFTIPVSGGRIEFVGNRDELVPRQKKEIARLRSEVERSEQKLRNERFLAHAKDDVVEIERAKLKENRETLRALEAVLSELESQA